MLTNRTGAAQPVEGASEEPAAGEVPAAAPTQVVQPKAPATAPRAFRLAQVGMKRIEYYEDARPSLLTDLYQSNAIDPESGRLVSEDILDLATLPELSSFGSSKYWDQRVVYFQLLTNAINGSVLITRVQQGAPNPVQTFNKNMLNMLEDKERNRQLNDIGYPYTDPSSQADADTDLNFVYTDLKSGLAIQGTLERSSLNKKLILSKFTRLLVHEKVLGIDAIEANNFFKTFGAFCKVLCCKERGRNAKLTSAWDRQKIGLFSKRYIADTIRTLLKPDNKKLLFSADEQSKLGIYATQVINDKINQWSDEFMVGFDATEANSLVYLEGRKDNRQSPVG